MKPDQERVKNLLTDTVTLLCKNGLTFTDELRVEGLLGITLDNNEIFLVHINEKFGEANSKNAESGDVDSLVDLTGLKNKSVNSSQGQQRPSSRDSERSLASPKKVNNSQNRTSQSPIEGIRIKQEHDVIVVDKTDRPLSSCAQQRNPGSMYPHSPSQRHMDTSRRSSSDMNRHNFHPSSLELSVENMQGSFPKFEQITSDGEPPTKRRTMGSETGDDSSGGDSLGAYITGIVKNVHDKPDPSGWTPPAVNLGAEIAAQMAQAAMAQGDNSLAGLETSMSSMPGCSNWSSTGQNMGTPTSQHSDMWLPKKMNTYPRRGRPPSLEPKTIICNYPGCGQVFKHRPNLYRHQKNFNHRPNRSIANLSETYGHSNDVIPNRPSPSEQYEPELFGDKVQFSADYVELVDGQTAAPENSSSYTVEPVELSNSGQ